MTPPTVSVVTPTADRRRFIPQLLRLFLAQDYPPERLELVLLDDGGDPIDDLLPPDPRIRCVRPPSRLPLGEKRNRLAALARGEILVHMDDDDWYPADRVSMAVRLLTGARRPVLGQSALLVYRTGTGVIRRYPRAHDRHAHGATLAYRRGYWAANPFPAVDRGEESGFLRGFTQPIVQLRLPPERVMLCVDHGGNTWPKDTTRPPSHLRLEDVVGDPVDRAFYRGLADR